jgi:hypothetical protein
MGPPRRRAGPGGGLDGHVDVDHGEGAHGLVTVPAGWAGTRVTGPDAGAFPQFPQNRSSAAAGVPQCSHLISMKASPGRPLTLPD